MNKRINVFVLFSLISCSVFGGNSKINRYAVVSRNNPHVTSVDSLSSLSVGNGGFAFTVDATGLQSFPEKYSKGIPLGTMSDWGWHSFDNPNGYKFEETLRNYDFGRGRLESYAVQIKDNARQKAACNWYRVNAHRLHLGVVGLELGNDIHQIKSIDETLDMYRGVINSKFKYKGKAYHVSTVCDPVSDRIASDIVSDGKITVKFRFPYPSGGHSDDACNWTSDNLHSTVLVKNAANWAILKRTIGKTVYYVTINWQGNAKLRERSRNYYVLDANGKELSFTCLFSEKETAPCSMTFNHIKTAADKYWQGYWTKGAIADFSQCKADQAREMERRVVLSQYLLAIQDCGDTPPQETGLTYNSWFGKFHLEMILWHQAQFALWGHPEMLDRSLSWYFKVEDKAREIARRQGFKGVRWMKMTDTSGDEAPSDVGSFLIWQQPHLIYLAELLYRADHSKAVLNKYARLVEETAEFMADFAQYDSVGNRYILRGCIAAQETLPASTTVNPPFELSYWHFALQIAQSWRERLGKDRNAHWDDIISKISPLADKDGLYLAAETQPDTYSNERMYSDHPAVLGAVGVLPFNSHQVDIAKMKKTEQWIWKNWKWDTTWGWDYPMMAMCAARMGEPDKAVSALLMNQQKNTYLVSGHNYQDDRLRLYLPGNGGLLMSVAMMCAGWDGSTTTNVGFPNDGNWNVKWEGLKPLP